MVIRGAEATSTPYNGSPVSICKYKKLRTLLACDLNVETISWDLILQLKCLRTLNLKGNSIEELPEAIGELSHLLYLNLLKNSCLKELPHTVGNLYNLQTLCLIYCKSLVKLPDTMRNLINLKHLYTYLSGSVKLGSLRNMDQLRGSLCINGLSDINTVSEAKEAQLVKKELLVELNLSFSVDKNYEKRWRDGQILNALQPHPNLEESTILHYHGTNFFCEFLPPLGNLHSLEILEISWVLGVKKVGLEFLDVQEQTSSSSSFPKLKQLCFKDVQWEEWEGGAEHSEITIMPSLSSLTLWNNLKLKTLPDLLWKTPLKFLEISDFPILKQDFEIGSGKLWDKTSHIPNIKINHQFVRQDGVPIQPNLKQSQN